MFARTALALALLAGVAHQPALGYHDRGPADRRAAAIEACIAINDYAPAMLVEAVDDGLGDYLVWVEDRDGDLWMCNADAFGNIYFNVMLMGDLLYGHGLELAGLQEAGLAGGPQADPALSAERLCEAVLGDVFWADAMDVVTVPDGLGDYLVWLETREVELWACNASADGVLYAFEPVDWPIAAYEPAPAA